MLAKVYTLLKNLKISHSALKEGNAFGYKTRPWDDQDRTNESTDQRTNQNTAKPPNAASTPKYTAGCKSPPPGR